MTESGNAANAYKYQTAANRTYRFEVTDLGGYNAGIKKKRMMKRIYQNPTMTIVRMEHQSVICTSLTDLVGNGDMDYGGGSSGNGRARELDDFFDDWDD